MSTAIDSSVSTFRYQMDVSIDPPPADSKVKTVNNATFKAKTIKDEDVQVINGEIKVVTNKVTQVQPTMQPADYCYDYSALKNGLTALAKIAKDAGSNMNGQVVVQDHDNEQTFRIKITDNRIAVEEGKRAVVWPDGTTSPLEF